MTNTSALSDHRLSDKPRRRSRAWRLTLMTATAVAITLIPNNAQAVLNIYLFDGSDGKLMIESRGKLNLGTSSTTYACPGGASLANILANANRLLQGKCPPDQLAYNIQLVAGSEPWGTSTHPLGGFFNGSSFSLTPGLFATNIPSNDPISSTAAFTSSITDLGLNGTGARLLARYKLPETDDTINLFADTPLPPTPANVPAPLPLAGAAAAFGWSRRLRRRISLKRHT